MSLQKLVESRLQSMEAERTRLSEAWAQTVGAVEKYYAKQGKVLSIHEKRNIGRVCENALMESAFASKSKLFEAGTTTSSNIDFLGIQLPVISALLPSLVLNKIATVQALDRRTGGVFYLDVKYGQTKGNVSAGGTLIGAKTGQASTAGGKTYGSTRVNTETITGTTGTLAYYPTVAGTLVITNGAETLTETSTGVLTSSLSGGRTGTIVASTGVWTITGALSGGGTMTASYRYDYENGGLAGAVAANVPTVDIDVTYDTVTAEDFPLRANYTLASALDLNKSGSLHSNVMYN